MDSRTLCVSIGDLYSEEIIYKCFYWYGGAFSLIIDRNDTGFLVTLTSLENELSDTFLDKLVIKIKADLVDYKTRQIVQNETKNIREILLAKAFSKLDYFDEAPKGTIDDPLGFKID